MQAINNAVRSMGTHPQNRNRKALKPAFFSFILHRSIGCSTKHKGPRVPVGMFGFGGFETSYDESGHSASGNDASYPFRWLAI